MPLENATSWGNIFDRLKNRVLQRLGLIVADGIKGLDNVIGEKFPSTPFQRCVSNLKCTMFAKVRQGSTAVLAADPRYIFCTGQQYCIVEMAWTRWQDMCARWGMDNRTINLLRNNSGYKAYMTYLNYPPEIQAMIDTKNWIERLNRDFWMVTRISTASLNEESVLSMICNMSMDPKVFDRALPGMTINKTLFPD